LLEASISRSPARVHSGKLVAVDVKGCGLRWIRLRAAVDVKGCGERLRL
jgi:hypothetical protein